MKGDENDAIHLQTQLLGRLKQGDHNLKIRMGNLWDFIGIKLA